MNVNRTQFFVSVLLVWMVCSTFQACRPKEADIIAPSEFTKAQREALGKAIRIAIAFEDEQFPVLPDIPPYDTTVYYYIQTLYSQVTNDMRADHHSPADNRWNPDREWQIFILQRDERNAFIIPGGNLYLTTGLLEGLETEHELYYILAFEANLMNSKDLLYELFNRFSTNALAEIVDENTKNNDVLMGELLEVIDRLSFDYDVVRKTDRATAEVICETSIMNRLGILRLAEEHNSNWFWLTFRTNYGGRKNYVRNLSNTAELDCGNFRTNGNYQRYVLNHL